MTRRLRRAAGLVVGLFPATVGIYNNISVTDFYTKEPSKCLQQPDELEHWIRNFIRSKKKFFFFKKSLLLLE